jgi:hypothetical protein
MTTKAQVKQRIMKIVSQTWELKSGEQLDPVIQLFIDAFSGLSWETQNEIESIKEEILQQVASALTPDSLVTALPAHTVIKVMPAEPILEIGKHTAFYTNRLPESLTGMGIKSLGFAPVIDSIRLVRGEINSLLCENNFYRVGRDGEKDLFAKASTFTQATNRCIWIGLTLDPQVESLKDIHFYIEFPNTVHCYELYDLLAHTHWSINGQTLNMLPEINHAYRKTTITEDDIFSRYNTFNTNERDIMDLYRKQFLHITNDIRRLPLEKQAFPVELLPFFPERVREQEPQYWIKVTFPTFFKTDELNDIAIHLNAFPVSNKNLKYKTLDRNKNLTGIAALTLSEGEHFFDIAKVEDSHGREYRYLPYALSGKKQGGTYTLNRGNPERFGRKQLTTMLESLISMMHSELAIFLALKTDNLRNVLTDIEQGIHSIQNRMENNNSRMNGSPVYLLIDAEEEDPYIYIDYWTTNCEAANELPYGSVLHPVHFIPVERDSCVLLKKVKGGKSIPKNKDMLLAYKHALTTHDRLYSATDYENYCRMKFGSKLQQVEIRRGITCSAKPKEGLVRTIDICLTPFPEYMEMMLSPLTKGELKLELEKRSPYLYNFRILVEETLQQPINK